MQLPPLACIIPLTPDTKIVAQHNIIMSEISSLGSQAENMSSAGGTRSPQLLTGSGEAETFFWRAPSRRPVSKGPHLSFFSFFSSRGPLLDWFRQIMLYSHWSTQTECSTHSCSKQPLMKLCGCSLYRRAVGFSTQYK